MLATSGLLFLVKWKAADIIFIHGLQNHPYKTWTYLGNGANEGIEKERGFSFKTCLNWKAKSRITSTCFHWPRGLPPQDLKNARILTYGNDSHVSMGR